MFGLKCKFILGVTVKLLLARSVRSNRKNYKPYEALEKQTDKVE